MLSLLVGEERAHVVKKKMRPWAKMKAALWQQNSISIPHICMCLLKDENYLLCPADEHCAGLFKSSPPFLQVKGQVPVDPDTTQFFQIPFFFVVQTDVCTYALVCI